MTLIKYLFLAVLVLISISCEDDGLVGESIKPGKDQLEVSKLSDFDIRLSSFHPDSLKTDSQNQLLLGSYWQKDFGTISSDIAMQFRYDELDIDKERALAGEIVVDSVALVLVFNDYYGDSVAINAVKVFELDSAIDNSRKYYSNSNEADLYSEGNLLGSAFFTGLEPNVHDSIRTDPDYLFPLRVKLNKEIGERIITNYEEVTTSIEAFQKLFKGVYIKSSFGNRTMLSIPTEFTRTIQGVQVSDFNSLQMFYHYKTNDVDEDTVRMQYFLFNNECGRFNKFTYNFEGTEFEGKTELLSENLYVRGMGGLNIRLGLPNFSTLPQLAPLPGQNSARIAINSAKISFSVNRELMDISKDYPIDKLVIRLDSILEDGQYDRVIDDNTAFDQTYLGGSLGSKYDYYFNITEQVQYWVKHPELQKDLIIQPVRNSVNPLFTIIKGANAEENPFKLEIIYSRY